MTTNSWWKRTTNYLSSHSNLFIVTGGIVGGAYLVSQYAISKFQQIQDKLVQDKSAKENLRRRFAQNQEDCTFTVLALLPTVGDQLFAKLNVEQLTESLRAQSSLVNKGTESPATEPETAHAALPSQPDADSAATPQASTAVHEVEAEAESNVAQQTEEPSATAVPESDPTPAEPTADETSKPVDEQEIPTPAIKTQFNPLAKAFVLGAKPAPTHAPESVSEAQPETQVAPTEGPAEPFGSSVVMVEPPTYAAAAPASAPQTSQEENGAATIEQAAAKEHVISQPSREHLIAERQAKLKLWNELKIVAFSRTVTSLYCVALLTLQTHIQLNLIGRFAYLASIESQAKPQQDEADGSSASMHEAFEKAWQDGESPLGDLGLDHETERLYLTFSWWFLHRGWDRLSDKVSKSIERVFSALPVKAQITMADLRGLLNEARVLVEHDLTEQASAVPDSSEHSSVEWKRSNFLSLLFPPSQAEEIEALVKAGAATAEQAPEILRRNTRLRALLDETKDIIESPDFLSVVKLCLDRVFDVFFNTMAPTFGVQPTSEAAGEGALASPRFQELTEDMQEGRKIRLATLFPAVARQSQLAIHGVPNEYIESLADTKELRAFSAIIYSAWPKE